MGDAFRFRQNVQKVDDFCHDVFVVADDFFLVEAGQVAQAHAQDGVGLDFAQIIALFLQAEVGGQTFGTRHAQVEVGTAQHVFHQAAAPCAGQQFFFGFGRVGGFFNQPNHLVDIGQCDGFTFGDMAFMTRFFQAEQCAAGNDFATVAQKFRQNLFQVQQARLTVNQSNHIDAEAVLKLGEFVELV